MVKLSTAGKAELLGSYGERVGQVASLFLKNDKIRISEFDKEQLAGAKDEKERERLIKGIVRKNVQKVLVDIRRERSDRGLFDWVMESIIFSAIVKELLDKSRITLAWRTNIPGINVDIVDVIGRAIEMVLEETEKLNASTKPE